MLKKALIMMLSILTVVFMATSAFALDVTYEGEVAVKWGGDTDTDPGFGTDELDLSLTLDFTKDYGNGVSAGVETLVEFDNDEVFDPSTTRELDFDGGAWIQLERDLFTAKASTEIDGNAAKDLGGEYDITGAPGLGLDLRVFDGLTINTVVNAGPEYGYVAKGEYASDLFTVGGGYQNEAALSKSAYAVYGTANVLEPLTVSAEYASRTTAKDEDAINAILAQGAYKQGALDASAAFLMQDIGFISLTIDDDDFDDYRAHHQVRLGQLEYMIVYTDLAYQVTDAFALNGNFDAFLSAKDINGDDFESDDKVSYKAGAAYTYDALKFEAWYKAFQKSEVAGKVTYTLADGVDASLKVGFGKANKDADGKVSYSALVKAAL